MPWPTSLLFDTGKGKVVTLVVRLRAKVNAFERANALRNFNGDFLKRKFCASSDDYNAVIF